MKLLIAEDDRVFCRLLRDLLEPEYDIVTANDGDHAWEVLQSEGRPRMAVLDWMMPGLEGPSICRKVRAHSATALTYLLLVTARESIKDVVAGLEAGADDYVTKPFDPQVFRARLRVGKRIVELQSALAERVDELQDALARVRVLQGLLPICSYCKRIRDDRNYWQQLETYFTEHSDATFTHGVCPDCYEKRVKPQIASAKRSSGRGK
ncbi:MAG TPA: response regulator [Acidobacteriaceae bacterium]|nr:response regulator [Acidobacteriaceae bacterium]